jgi:hypothetical protein
MSGTQLLNIEKPHCEIFRRMLGHPEILRRLVVMCGKGVRLDHGPQFIGGVKGTSGHRLHGSGAPHRTTRGLQTPGRKTLRGWRDRVLAAGDRPRKQGRIRLRAW